MSLDPNTATAIIAVATAIATVAVLVVTHMPDSNAVIAVATMGGVLVAVIIGLWTIRITRAFGQATLAAALIDDYSKPEMLESIQAVGRWYDAHQRDGRLSAAAFAAQKQTNDLQPDWNKDLAITRLDQHRRRVAFYFHKVARFRKLGALSHDQVRMIVFGSQLELAFDIMCPMEAAIAKTLPQGERADRPTSDYETDFTFDLLRESFPCYRSPAERAARERIAPCPEPA